jgi:hypothetical protein
MSDILIERMRKAIRKLDDRVIASRASYYDLEANDLRELLEQAIERIESAHRSVHYLMGLRP